MAEHKSGFIYMHSSILCMEIAYCLKTGVVYCEDGAVYTRDELEFLYRAGSVVSSETHKVKKTFGGTVVDVIVKDSATQEAS